MTLKTLIGKRWVSQGLNPSYELPCTWGSPADLKRAFGANVDFVGDSRAIFDIGGNKYRLIVHFAHLHKAALIKFVGTHKDYDKINAEMV